MTSATFFRLRPWILLLLFWASMLIECGGVALFLDSSPGAAVLAVFLSSLLSSWLYGGVVTYLEGRTKTDALLAVITFFYIYAGCVDGVVLGRELDAQAKYLDLIGGRHRRKGEGR